MHDASGGLFRARASARILNRLRRWWARSVLQANVTFEQEQASWLTLNITL